MSDRPPAPPLAALVRGRTPLAVAVTPVLFVYFGLFLPAASMARFSVGFTIGAGIVMAAASATVFAVERRLAVNHGFGAAAQLRELVGVLTGAALVAWLLERQPLAALLRSGEFWAMLIAAGLAFALSAAVRSRTARQEFFLSAVARMTAAATEGPEGERVAAVTRELSEEAGESAAALLSLRRWLIFFLVWFAGLLVVTGWMLRVAGVVDQVGICAATMVVLAALVSVGRLHEEQHILTLGLVPERTRRPAETGLAVLLFGAAAIVAGLVALHRALISRAALAAFGAWLLRIMSSLRFHSAPPAAPPPRPRFIPPRPPELAHQLQSIAPAHGWHFVATVLTYLAWGVAAAAAIGFLWLLFAPLFRLQRRGVSFSSALRLLGARFVNTLRRWAAEIRDAVAGVREVRGAGGGTVRPAERPGRSTRRRARRLLAIGGNERRFSGAFRRLAKWGGDRGALFAPSLGPREYTTLLASRVPGVRPTLAAIAELYERELFSPTRLSGRERASYYRMIKEVVRGSGS